MGATFQAELYSQYGGIHPNVSQSGIPTTSSSRTMMLKLLRSPCVKTGLGHGSSWKIQSSRRPGKELSSSWLATIPSRSSL